MSLFSFDTSSLLNGRRDLLPPEIFTSLWDNVESMIDSGDVRCVDVVKDELNRRDETSLLGREVKENCSCRSRKTSSSRRAECSRRTPS